MPEFEMVHKVGPILYVVQSKANLENVKLSQCVIEFCIDAMVAVVVASDCGGYSQLPNWPHLIQVSTYRGSSLVLIVSV